MYLIEEKSITCPYCNEKIGVTIDLSDMNQSYIEDCQVCCRPISFVISEGVNEALIVNVYREDDTYN
ncbi:CPXCG motif-containing cysteine-rich protein [Vibrio sp. ZSDE26]|uniref:CPXCG motif-containing cysteine-rich protein n=1 Tax=Vibrio amylolyticus TaxID=2847292 RepID=A0A9X1XF08_9VIBR|nr:CPXCG motif-containing cysteine-rich protein [Vibrio amylolyticus]MCK6261689.1 CPXCG motif-containing cysteine-rich protein [Vibrio amylolyticus]